MEGKTKRKKDKLSIETIDAVKKFLLLAGCKIIHANGVVEDMPNEMQQTQSPFLVGAAQTANFNETHTLVLIQACIDILHKTRSLSIADTELKNAFEQLCLAKEKIECRTM